MIKFSLSLLVTLVAATALAEDSLVRTSGYVYEGLVIHKGDTLGKKVTLSFSQKSGARFFVDKFLIDRKWQRVRSFEELTPRVLESNNNDGSPDGDASFNEFVTLVFSETGAVGIIELHEYPNLDGLAGERQGGQVTSRADIELKLFKLNKTPVKPGAGSR